ncbi:MAG: DUF3108 domain-containing protein, partial [Candidatus Omnitrophica bacterium]|nr:DUF3108 domain-containing protein [Candidatus Omnitrophota bacterium]
LACARRAAMGPPAIYSREWQEKDIVILKSEMSDFKSESYIYKVRWLGLTVAEAEFKNLGLEEYKGTECYHIVIRARTNKVLNLMFKVNDEFHSYIDSQNLRPLAYIAKRREGSHFSESETIFDYANKKIIYRSLLDNSQRELELYPDYHDFISCFYSFRASDLKKDRYNFKAVQKTKVWDIDIGIIKKGMLEMRGHGTLEAILVNIKAVSGEEKARGQAWVWFSADSKKTPLLGQFDIDIPVVGTVTAALHR